MQDEKDVQCAFQGWIGRVFGLCHFEHHVQKITGIAEIVIWVDITQAAIVPVRVRGNARHLGNQPLDLHQPICVVVHIVCFGIKC